MSLNAVDEEESNKNHADWLTFQFRELQSTIDKLTFDANEIQEKSILNNLIILNEDGPESAPIGDKIVTDITCAISNAIEKLRSLSETLATEGQQRFKKQPKLTNTYASSKKPRRISIRKLNQSSEESNKDVKFESHDDPCNTNATTSCSSSTNLTVSSDSSPFPKQEESHKLELQNDELNKKSSSSSSAAGDYSVFTDSEEPEVSDKKEIAKDKNGIGVIEEDCQSQHEQSSFETTTDYDETVIHVPASPDTTSQPSALELEEEGNQSESDESSEDEDKVKLMDDDGDVKKLTRYSRHTRNSQSSLKRLEIYTDSEHEEEVEEREKPASTPSKLSFRKNRGTKRLRIESDDSDEDFVGNKNTSESDSGESMLSIRSEDSDFKPVTKKRSKKVSPQDTKTERRKTKFIEESSGNDSDETVFVEEPSTSSEAQLLSQKGRRNIRQIKSGRELAQATRDAQKEEDERRKRLEKKQIKSLSQSQSAGLPETTDAERVSFLVLDQDSQEVLQVDKSIVGVLKPHQRDGIMFMWTGCFESMEMTRKHEGASGCILSHVMGLGKTLQSVAFLHTLLTNSTCGIKTALVLCPLSTAHNWNSEFEKWTKKAPKLKIHNIFDAKKTIDARLEHLRAWQIQGGVAIMNYDLFRILIHPNKNSKPMNAGKKLQLSEYLLSPGPDIVICDEGHLLKNYKSNITKAVSQITTKRRVILTGTPLQNNLVEYHTMMAFVKPNLLGTLEEFKNRFVNPIENGQHRDSTPWDVVVMKKRAHVLHRKVESCVQRKDYTVLAPYLLPKYEYIINIKLSDTQEMMYKHYLAYVVEPNEWARRRYLFMYHAALMKVWSHPLTLTMNRKKNDDLEENQEEEFLQGIGIDNESTVAGPSKKKRAPRGPNGEEPPNFQAQAKWWMEIISKEAMEEEGVEISGKMVVLQDILRACCEVKDKVLVFSQYLTSLDVIEIFLKEWDEDGKNGRSSTGRWRLGREYYRLDGATKVADRHKDCEMFNSPSSKAKLYLISTRAGGLGINLYGANRVIIFDASWNPSHDMQAIFRVYRFGQTKSSYIYRLIAKGTMEQKKLRRQITKLSLASRVVDEHQCKRHYKFDDIYEMYVYDEEDYSQPLETPAVPKDRLLADLLLNHGDWIRGYEEVDSLLENKLDEGLTNEEKDAAWQEFRTETDRAKKFEAMEQQMNYQDNMMNNDMYGHDDMEMRRSSDDEMDSEERDEYHWYRGDASPPSYNYGMGARPSTSARARRRQKAPRRQVRGGGGRRGRRGGRDSFDFSNIFNRVDGSGLAFNQPMPPM